MRSPCSTICGGDQPFRYTHDLPYPAATLTRNRSHHQGCRKYISRDQSFTIRYLSECHYKAQLCIRRADKSEHGRDKVCHSLIWQRFSGLDLDLDPSCPPRFLMSASSMTMALAHNTRGLLPHADKVFSMNPHLSHPMDEPFDKPPGVGNTFQDLLSAMLDRFMVTTAPQNTQY